MHKISVRVIGKGKAQEVVRDIPDDMDFSHYTLNGFAHGFIHALSIEEPRMRTTSSMQLTSISVFRAGSMFAVIRLEKQEEL